MPGVLGVRWKTVLDQTQLLRSLMFVPADSETKQAKALSTDADALIVDLEDAVAPANKAAARQIVARFLKENRGAYRGAILVRFHDCASPEFAKDCEVLREAVPDGIVLSKCRSAEDVRRLEAALPGTEVRCAFIPMIESALALLNAHAIATASLRLIALAFGAEDFSSDVAITRTHGEPELAYARSAIVVAARAAGLGVIDTPYVAYKDETGLLAAAQNARNLGFSGKLAIHPAQLAMLNRVFQPTDDEVADAQRVVDWASAYGTGATAMDGRMIDEAIVRRARGVLRRRDQAAAR
jgi:citrate lyase subunit beta / citryl-CoA lyase